MSPIPCGICRARDELAALGLVATDRPAELADGIVAGAGDLITAGQNDRIEAGEPGRRLASRDVRRIDAWEDRAVERATQQARVEEAGVSGSERRRGAGS